MHFDPQKCYGVNKNENDTELFGLKVIASNKL